MNKAREITYSKCEKLLKTQGDYADVLIPDSDQEEYSQSPISNLINTPNSKKKPLKKLRFSGTNQICYFSGKSSKNNVSTLSPSPRNKSQSIQSILKTKETTVFQQYT